MDDGLQNDIQLSLQEYATVKKITKDLASKVPSPLKKTHSVVLRQPVLDHKRQITRRKMDKKAT